MKLKKKPEDLLNTLSNLVDIIKELYECYGIETIVYKKHIEEVLDYKNLKQETTIKYHSYYRKSRYEQV